ncbi:hypothetical protein GCM10023115_22580 [Pontixanthobacter gangjinensis]|uniref:Oligosaccharide flippase family protein n=1 Tax=Pontixanthobacter gangjinensis TaxID=1028742 RepID=A0A6I4SNK3_9SPHN|nr:oligosaccharide flippase family protein [Pontixanthobacter gangjinensis]MXO57501.1 oligosaccharide flippase family protein [Pontixanthobacter gangjinensis]
MTGQGNSLLRRGVKLASGPIARASMTSVIIRVAGLALTFIAMALAARMLGANGYGQASFALSVAQICATLALLGYNSMAIREVARRLKAGQIESLRQFARKAIVAVLVSSAFLSVAIVALVAINSDAIADYQAALLPAAFSIPLLAAIQLFRGITQGFGQTSNAQWPGDIVRPAILAIAMLVLILTGQTLLPPTFLTIYTMTALVAVGIGGFIVSRIFRNLAPSRSPESVGCQRGRENLSFFGLALVTVLFAEFATLMLGLFATAKEAGIFQPIVRLTPLMTIPVQAAAMRFSPRVAELWEGGEQDRLRAVTRVFTITTSLLTIMVALGIAILGPWILAAFGPEFISAAPLIWIVAAGQIFNALCGPIGHLLTMTGHARAALHCQLLGLCAAVTTGLWLIPSIGTLGAAFAVTAGIVVWNSALLLVARKKLGFNPSIIGALINR